MTRWLPLGWAVWLMAGCSRPAPPAAPPAPPALPPTVETTGDLLASLTEAVAQCSGAGAGNAELARAAALERLDRLVRMMPGAGARERLQAALTDLGDGSAAPSEEALARLDEAVSAGRGELAAGRFAGDLNECAAEVLDEAEAAVAARRWRLARLELQRASALAGLPVVEAAATDLRLALRGGGAAGTALASLRGAVLTTEARAAVGRARELAETLALSEARHELDQATARIVAWAGAEPARQKAAQSILADIAGAQRDLDTNAPGLRQRLAALWEKLRREPVAAGGGTTPS